MRVNHLLRFLSDIFKPGGLHCTPTRGTVIVGIESPLLHLTSRQRYELLVERFIVKVIDHRNHLELKFLPLQIARLLQCYLKFAARLRVRLLNVRHVDNLGIVQLFAALLQQINAKSYHVCKTATSVRFDQAIFAGKFVFRSV